MRRILWLLILISILLNADKIKKETYVDLNGVLDSEVFYKGGIIIEKRKYHKNGKLETIIPYKNGVENGIATGHDNRGNLLYIINYKNGKRNGLETWYYPNGNIFFKVNFKNGKAHGIYTEYYKNGKLKNKDLYENGIKKDKTLWYKKDKKLTIIAKNHAIVIYNKIKYIMDTYVVMFENPYYVFIERADSKPITNKEAINISKDYIKDKGCTEPIKLMPNLNQHNRDNTMWIIGISC